MAAVFCPPPSPSPSPCCFCVISPQPIALCPLCALFLHFTTKAAKQWLKCWQDQGLENSTISNAPRATKRANTATLRPISNQLGVSRQVSHQGVFPRANPTALFALTHTHSLTHSHTHSHTHTHEQAHPHTHSLTHTHTLTHTLTHSLTRTRTRTHSLNGACCGSVTPWWLETPTTAPKRPRAGHTSERSKEQQQQPRSTRSAGGRGGSARV